MSLIGSNILAGSSGQQGYQISRSVRLRSSASAFLNRLPATTTNQKTWTWSGWVKRGILTSGAILFSAGGTNNDITYIGFSPTDQIDILTNIAGVTVIRKITTSVYRDPSAWYHIVVVVDTTNATAGNRVLLYINGVQIIVFTTSTNPTLNLNTQVDSTVAHVIGRSSATSTTYFDGYLTETNFIDGQALTPTSFGEFNAITGVWQPKKYAGTYGTNGFYLNFSDNSAATAAAIGKDYSGNGNNWTPNNISVTAGVTYDSMLDVPTPYADGGNGRGNYPTLNPVQAIGYTPYSNGNLKFTSPVSALFVSTLTDIAGKWYFELTAESIATPASFRFGAGNINYFANGDIVVGVATVATVASYTNGNVIGAAIDRVSATNTMSFYKNGILQGTYTINTTPSFGVQINAAAPDSASFNFGQRPFTYTPPTGFLALNTQNLPASTIVNGAAYMAATTYTGTGTTQSIANTVNGVSLQPDLVWLKSRSLVGSSNYLYDTLRGVTKSLTSNDTNAEQTIAQTLISFNSNGFTLGTAGGAINGNGSTFVGWQWKAGGTAVTNTAGSISSQVSANVSAGFSVVTYTGTGANATVGHGMGVAPKMVIVKSRNSVNNWTIYHAGLTSASYCIFLDLTNAQLNNATVWQATNPTSSVFSVGTSGAVNNNTTNFVAYCFAEVAGYSKFGSYTGNGSADGPFVYLGFRPRFVMIKRTDTGPSNWTIQDTSRNTYNIVDSALYPNLSNAETTQSALDILSNGFKLRHSTTEQNGSGATYIYACFAENPFSKALAR